MVRFQQAPLLLALALSACSGTAEQGSVSCGLAAMNGPLVAMEGFARGKGLAYPPASLPATLPGRYVAGPIGSVAITRDSSGLFNATMELAPATGSSPGFGIVIMAKAEPMGVLIYDGAPVPGALQIGTLTAADSTLPLYGVRVERSTVETEKCPLFPPSASRTDK